MKRIYLAGPDVFLPDALEVGRQKVDICRRHGLIGLYPSTMSLIARPPTLRSRYLGLTRP